MSWTVQAMGKGSAVGAALKEQFDAIGRYGMNEPEQTVANKVGEIVALTAAAAPDTGFVIRAEGHQYRQTLADGSKGGFSSHLKVEIDAITFHG